LSHWIPVFSINFGSCDCRELKTTVIVEALNFMGTLSKHHLLFRFLFLPLLATVFFYPVPRQAFASIVVHLALEDLVRQADLIVLGSCEEKISSWDTKGKTILTNITIASERCFQASDCPPLIKVRQEGGTVDNVTLTVVGAPQFHKNERVILFLEETSSDDYRVIGLSQGKFTVIHRPRDGKYYVQRDLSTLKFLKKEDNETFAEKPTELRKEAELESFINKIKSYLELP